MIPEMRRREDDLPDDLEAASRPSRTRPRAGPAGTARIASSEIEAISGVISRPTTIPPDSAEKMPMLSEPSSGRRRCGAMKFRPKNPSTIVGTPAIVSRIGLTIVRTRGDAYSDSRTAASRPERDRDEDRDSGDEEGSGEERQHAPRLGLDQGRPVGAREELDRADLEEELERSRSRGPG